MITTVQEDTDVQLFSSDPELVPVPDSITILAGDSRRWIQIDPECLPSNSPVTVTITASLGDASHSFPVTIQPRGDVC